MVKYTSLKCFGVDVRGHSSNTRFSAEAAKLVGRGGGGTSFDFSKAFRRQKEHTKKCGKTPSVPLLLPPHHPTHPIPHLLERE